MKKSFLKTIKAIKRVIESIYLVILISFLNLTDKEKATKLLEENESKIVFLFKNNRQ